jgi:hypothetical protein
MGHVAQMGEMRNAYKTLVRTCEEKRPHGGPWFSWEDSFE